MPAHGHPDRGRIGGVALAGELIATLLRDGGEVTVLDDLSTAEPDHLAAAKRPERAYADAQDQPAPQN